MKSPLLSRRMTGGPSGTVIARCRPSPVTSRSGVAVQHGRADRAHRQRHQPEPARPRRPQAQPQPAEDHRRQSSTATWSAGSPPRLAVRRPSARARASWSIAQPVAAHRGAPSPIGSSNSAPRLERHDHEGGPGDRDEIGADAVKPGLVEMIEGERDQRDLDRQTGGDQRAPMPRNDRAPTIPSSRGPSQRFTNGRLCKRDDRGDRREAQLEARSGQRFGLDQQHQQRADRDQSEAERIAAERNSRQHQQRRDAAAHGRHLHPGQERITDPGQRPDGSRDQHQIEPSCQRTG